MIVQKVTVKISEPSPDFGRETFSSPMRGVVKVTVKGPARREGDYWLGGREVSLSTFGPTDREHVETTITRAFDELERQT